MTERQHLEDQLSREGYTGISVTPMSFLIHAVDKTGQPTVLVLGPDSVTQATEVSPEQANPTDVHLLSRNAPSASDRTTGH